MTGESHRNVDREVVAQLACRPAEIAHGGSLEWEPGADDFDAFQRTEVVAPNGARVTLLAYDHDPDASTLVIAPNGSLLPEDLEALVTELGLETASLVAPSAPAQNAYVRREEIDSLRAQFDNLRVQVTMARVAAERKRRYGGSAPSEAMRSGEQTASNPEDVVGLAFLRP